MRNETGTAFPNGKMLRCINQSTGNFN